MILAFAWIVHSSIESALHFDIRGRDSRFYSFHYAYLRLGSLGSPRLLSFSTSLSLVYGTRLLLPPLEASTVLLGKHNTADRLLFRRNHRFSANLSSGIQTSTLLWSRDQNLLSHILLSLYSFTDYNCELGLIPLSVHADMMLGLRNSLDNIYRRVSDQTSSEVTDLVANLSQDIISYSIVRAPLLNLTLPRLSPCSVVR